MTCLAGARLGRLLLARPRWFALGFGVWLSIALQVARASPADSTRGENQYFGFDFVAFGAAARVLFKAPSELYDVEALSRAASAWLGFEVRALPYANPPLLASALGPLAMLPFPVALAAWTTISAVALLVAARVTAPKLGARALALGVLGFPPVALVVAAGQSTWITALLTALALAASRRGRPALSGALAGLLVFRPHWFAPMLVVLALVTRRRARLLGCALAVAGAQCAASMAAQPEAWRAYVRFSREVLPHFKEWARFESATGVGLRDFFRALAPGAEGTLAILAALAGVAACARPLGRAEPRRAVALGCTLALWASPHVSAYDWALAGPGFLLAWEDEEARPFVVTAVAMVFLAVVSAPLTDVQTRTFGVALHLPTLFVTFATLCFITPWSYVRVVGREVVEWGEAPPIHRR